MSYTVLARKYRSQDFDEVIGQDHVAKTLKRAIESGRIAHAFLFTGTRGTGKTSMARILAKALNCEKAKGPTTKPCGLCESCKAIARGDDIDVIEIDAASNTGVDNVRTIIENAAYRPARSRFKVYIIDEVHMLSKAAFNALLKTLEEPPEHVKFILATTEAEKVLQTILSRCQRYDFRNIPTREIAGHLKEICAKEGIKAEEDALLLVAKAGAGSMRDSLSLLDRLLSIGEKELTVGMIEQLLGLPKAQLMFDLAQAIGQGDVKSVLRQSSEMMTRGLGADAMIAALVDHLRNLLILRTCGADCELVEVPGVALKDLVEQANRFDATSLTQDITILEELRRHMRQSQSGRALLDATLVRLTLSEQFTPVSELLERVGATATVGGNGAQKKNGSSADVVSEATQPPPKVEISPAVQEKPGPHHAPVPLVSGMELPATDPGLPVGSVPTVSAPPALDFDDEDDDLPRPGKVWDNSGPSLKELLAQQMARTETPVLQETPAPAADAFANLEPIAGQDLGALWKNLLELMMTHGPMFHSLIANGNLARIDGDQAVITYTKKNETFRKMLERNPKKDSVREGLTQILGKPMGVRFEVDESAEEEAPVRPASPAPPQAARTAAAARPAPPPEPAGPPAIRITPELIEQMKQDPLAGSIIETFNATPVKVE
jgi:DNA polymerase-3 subunit gamma/tau